MRYVVLGVIQGLTEFIPVSSSAHLVIAQKILYINGNILQIIAFAHIGTLLALFFYFFKSILKMIRSLRLLCYIILANSITAIIAFSFKHYFESMFNFNRLLGFSLIINGIIIFFTRFSLHTEQPILYLKIKDIVGFGIFQAIAIVPGISRSGMTISYLLFRGLKRGDAFKFSFLAGIPSIIGSFFLEAKIGFLNFYELKKLLLCLVISFLSGLVALWILRRFLHKDIFYYFGYYSILVGIAVIFMI